MCLATAAADCSWSTPFVSHSSVCLILKTVKYVGIDLVANIRVEMNLGVLFPRAYLLHFN